MEAFPHELASTVNLSASLSGADWERIAQKTYAQADHRCAFTTMITRQESLSPAFEWGGGPRVGIWSPQEEVVPQAEGC